MVITDKFVFIHMPKTAGQYISKVLMEYVPGAEKQVDHMLRVNLPACSENMPIIGLVRNPWDWYVSWYHYFKDHKKNHVFNLYSEDGVLDFKTTIVRLLYFQEKTDGSFDELKPTFDYGFYTWRFKQLFCNNAGDYSDVSFGRYENLQDDLFNLLEKYDVPLNKDTKDVIRQHERVNASNHDHYRSYYDDELIELVAKRENLFIDYFEYAFE